VAKKSTIATPQANIQKIVAETQKAAVTAIAAPFIKEKGFIGSRPGYVFKKGKSGLGYYQDVVLMKKQAKMLKKNEGSKPAAIKNKPTIIIG
jgi:hypothetical protein